MGGQTRPRNYQYLGSPQKGLYLKGLIPGMTPAQALTAIQTMADHSQKWHDGTTSRNIVSRISNDGLADLVNKLDNLGRDMKKLKESVHAIQVRHGEFGQTTPFNGNNEGKFRVGPPGYYTKTDNRPPYGERRQSLEELLAKHQEESARRSTEMEVWIKKLQENAEINIRNQSASLKNLETQIEQLTKEIHSNKTPNSSSGQIKIVTANQETYVLNKLHGVSFISETESDTPDALQHQLPSKELNLGSFTLPCTISNFNFYVMAGLGASINVMPRSIFKHLHLTNLKKTNMLCEMADMFKKAPLGIVENVPVKIDEFLFPSDFVIIDNTPSETTILGRPFLDTIHAEIDVFAGKFSLRINEDRISFDTMRKDHNYTNPSEKNFMVNSGLINRPQSPTQSNNQIDYEESGNWDNRSPNLEHEEMGIEDEDYHPPEVQVETFEVKKYSFEGRQSFVCVSKDLDNVLSLGRKNGSKFKEMIRKEVENNKTVIPLF
ncbi:reverse transcriptase domain-containing protein [Tanacetum coccineum]